MYNYLSNQCLSQLLLWVRVSIRTRCTALCDKMCKWLATGRLFSPGHPVYSTNKIDRHDIAEILFSSKRLAYHPLFIDVSVSSKDIERICIICVNSIDFACFLDFSIVFWNRSDSETFVVCFLNLKTKQKTLSKSSLKWIPLYQVHYTSL